MGQNIHLVHTLGLSHRFSRWPWHRLGDASKTKHMSRKQKRTIIIAASSTILATVMKNKKNKRRRPCCVRTWVSEERRQRFGAYHALMNELEDEYQKSLMNFISRTDVDFVM